MAAGLIQGGSIVKGAVCKGKSDLEKVAVIELTGLTKEQQEDFVKKMIDKVYSINKENERKVKYLSNDDPEGAYQDWNEVYPRGTRKDAFASGIEWARKHKN